MMVQATTTTAAAIVSYHRPSRPVRMPSSATTTAVQPTIRRAFTADLLGSESELLDDEVTLRFKILDAVVTGSFGHLVPPPTSGPLWLA